jgi:hypothetical protein
MRRLTRKALYLVVGWQAGVLLVALIGHVLHLSPTSGSDRQTTDFVESLFRPDPEKVEEARRLFERKRQEHFEEFGRALPPDPHNPVDEWGISLSLGGTRGN